MTQQNTGATPPPCPPEEEEPVAHTKVNSGVQPETSFEVGYDEAVKVNMKILTDLCLTPGITNLQNIVSNFQSLFGQAQRLEARLDAEALQSIIQARQHADELLSQRLTNYANVNAATLAAITSMTTQIQRQGDVGAAALYYNIPSEAIKASIADDVKNLVEAAMKSQGDALTKTMQDMQATLVALYQLLGLKSTPAETAATK
jgi:hypothetical protein